jgi:hypothetical protein
MQSKDGHSSSDLPERQHGNRLLMQAGGRGVRIAAHQVLSKNFNPKRLIR